MPQTTIALTRDGQNDTYQDAYDAIAEDVEGGRVSADKWGGSVTDGEATRILAESYLAYRQLLEILAHVYDDFPDHISPTTDPGAVAEHIHDATSGGDTNATLDHIPGARDQVLEDLNAGRVNTEPLDTISPDTTSVGFEGVTEILGDAYTGRLNMTCE